MRLVAGYTAEWIFFVDAEGVDVPILHRNRHGEIYTIPVDNLPSTWEIAWEHY